VHRMGLRSKLGCKLIALILSLDVYTLRTNDDTQKYNSIDSMQIYPSKQIFPISYAIIYPSRYWSEVVLGRL
jgi:hypothetical protein